MRLYRYRCYDCNRVYFARGRYSKDCQLCGSSAYTFLGGLSTLQMDEENMWRVKARKRSADNGT